MRAEDLTVEVFAAWKLSLRRRGYSPRSINHYLTAIRALYAFGGDTSLLRTVPRPGGVKSESLSAVNGQARALYVGGQLRRLLSQADPQLGAMLLLALNCGLGPNDVQDPMWQHFDRERLRLPRSKTGICQTFLLWPETLAGLALASGQGAH